MNILHVAFYAIFVLFLAMTVFAFATNAFAHGDALMPVALAQD